MLAECEAKRRIIDRAIYTRAKYEGTHADDFARWLLGALTALLDAEGQRAPFRVVAGEQNRQAQHQATSHHSSKAGHGVPESDSPRGERSDGWGQIRISYSDLRARMASAGERSGELSV